MSDTPRKIVADAIGKLAEFLKERQPTPPDNVTRLTPTKPTHIQKDAPAKAPPARNSDIC